MVNTTDGGLVKLMPTTIIKVRNYNSGTKEYVVDFDPPFKYKSSKGKREVTYLKRLTRKHIEAMCPSLGDESVIRVGDELPYELRLARGLVRYFLRKSLGYELKVKKVEDGKGINISFKPGKKIGGLDGTIDASDACLTLEQLERIQRVYSNGRVPKVGDVFAVYKGRFERVLISDFRIKKDKRNNIGDSLDNDSSDSALAAAIDSESSGLDSEAISIEELEGIRAEANKRK